MEKAHTRSDDHYFMYFPGNYRWSAGFLSMLSCSTWGGADIGEVDRIGQILKAAPKQTDEAWFDACVKVAKETHAHATRYEKSGHRVSAAPFYLRACKYYQMAERFRTPKDAIGLEAYKTSVDCFHAFTRMSDVKIDIVEVPFVDGSLPGYFVHAQNSNAERKPAVVFFDGLDVTKELLYMRGVPDLIKRGISVLIMDGPGTGEAIRFRKHYLRHDYEVAGSACVDWLEKRNDVNPKKIGIVANSLGGYYAPRCASMEPRFAACIAWGAIWDYYATWKRRIDAAFNAAMSVPGHHIMWILGVDTLDAALKKLEPFRLDGVVQKMRCPFLVAHGSEDEQVPLADAQALYNACGSKDKTLRVFTPEEGGAQHCMRDYAVLGVAEMWNWFEDKLVRN
jgi:dipeptidyl aminopeptidase/acylaminoacyl peptidase